MGNAATNRRPRTSRLCQGIAGAIAATLLAALPLKGGLAQLGGALPGTAGQGWHSSPACWDAPRAFHGPFDEELANRIVVDAVPARELPDRVPSPNQAYWYAIEHADFAQAAPWVSQVHVYTERRSLIRVTFRDHDNEELMVSWINEKLLFMRVWWGRIAASDLVLDVEREAFVSREMRWWGALAFEQFRGKPCETKP